VEWVGRRDGVGVKAGEEVEGLEERMEGSCWAEGILWWWGMGSHGVRGGYIGGYG